MAKKRPSGIHEKLKHESSEGFDTPGALSTATKVAIAIGVIAVIVIAIFYIGKAGTGQHAGGTRNCIKSVMGNEPDCSDNDGTPKNTYVNGKYVGVCSSIAVDGTCIK